MEAKAYGVHSPTAAMKDTLEKHRESVDHYTKKFRYVEGQVGCLVFLNGKPAGFEMLSRPDKYAMLHEKILRSYGISKIRITQNAEYIDYSVSQKEFESATSKI